MDAAEMQRRWQVAKDNLAAAKLCHDQGLYGPGATRAYYSCFQAMWVAVGDPPKGRWRHQGLIDYFCRGQWTTPFIAPVDMKPVRDDLLTLYYLRSNADYKAVTPSVWESQFGVDLADQVLQLVASRKNLTL
jgi:uncharacterized protein (UPF0332 family)